MPERSPQVFYGWQMVAYTFAIQFIVMGSSFYIFGVLLKPLTEALEADRFLISIGMTAQLVVSALLGPWLGGAIARYPIRPIMTAGIILLSLGLLAVSRASALWHFYLGFALIASVGFALAGPLPNAALVANWFVRRRGTAMGVSQFGITLSGAILVPVFTWIMVNYDWRTALIVFAVGVPALGLPIIWGGIVKTPEEKGLHPDGDAPGPEPAAAPSAPEDWTFRRALSDRRIWLIALVIGAGFMSISAVLLSVHSHLTDTGMTAMRASSVIAAMTAAGATAKPLSGVLMDHFNKKAVVFIFVGLQFSGVAGIVLFDSYTGMLIAAAVFGLGYGAQSPIFNILIATIFGRGDFPRVIGLMGPIMLPFNMLGLPLTTLIYQSYGTYLPAYVAVLALHVASAVCLAYLRIPDKNAD